MRLEVITQRPSANVRPTPILFVHGAWHGAWCWENFQPYFAERGYESHALSLRGHGASQGHDGIRARHRGADYVADVAQAASQLPRPPILIGHSMGGYVVQKYLETRAAPAAVLVAPAPVGGVLPFFLRMAARHPLPSLQAHLTWNGYALVETPRLVHESFFSADLPQDNVQRHFARLGQESYRAGLDMALFALPQPHKISPPPMLVMGAENDAVFTRAEIETTARAYHAQLEFFPNMAHDMMLEPGWHQVAERIIAWLKEKGL
jgi:pimeloyl-ACP methyl ester carboxylesterase